MCCMQVCVDVTCMYTNFGGRGLSSFGDTATIVHVLCCYSATNQNIIIIEQDKPKGLRMSEIVSDNDREERERERELNNKKRESYNNYVIKFGSAHA